MHTHTKLMLAISAAPKPLTNVPDGFSLGDVHAACAVGARCTTEKRLSAATSLLFQQDAGPKNLQTAAVRNFLKTHFEKLDTPGFAALYRLAHRLEQPHHLSQPAAADTKLKAILRIWLKLQPAAHQVLALEDMPEQQLAGIAETLHVANDLTAIKQALSDALSAADPQGPAQHQPDWAAAAAALPFNAGNAQAVPEPAIPPPPPPAAVQQPPPHNPAPNADEQIGNGEAIPQAFAGAGEQAAQYSVIAENDSGEPILAAVSHKGAAGPTHSRTTRVLIQLCKHDVVTRNALVRFALAIASTGHPTSVGTSPTRAFLFDAQNAQAAAGKPAEKPPKGKIPLWQDTYFQFRPAVGERRLHASAATSILFAPQSFDASIPLPPSDVKNINMVDQPIGMQGPRTAAKCIILDVDKLDNAETLVGVHQTASGASDALSVIMGELFSLVSTSEALTDVKEEYTLPDSAADSVTEARAKGALREAILEAERQVPVTSFSRRERLAAIPLALILSLANFNDAVRPRVEAAIRKTRQTQAGLDELWQAWLHALVGQGALPLAYSATAVDRAISLASAAANRANAAPQLTATAAQPPADPPTSAKAARVGADTPAPNTRRVSPRITAATGYRCVACGKNNHHVADCLSVSNNKAKASPQWLKDVFQSHQSQLAAGMPRFERKTRRAPEVPEAVDQKFDAFARRVAQSYGTKNSSKT